MPIHVLQVEALTDARLVELKTTLPTTQFAYPNVFRILDYARSGVFTVMPLLVPILVTAGTRLNWRFPPHDVLFNAICNPDESATAMRIAAQLEKASGRPVVNPAAAIAHTTRDGTAAVCAGIEGLHVPSVARIAPRYRDDVLALAAEAGVTMPMIVRPAGSHNASGMALLRAQPDVRELDRFAFDGRPFYAIAFCDFRSADGLYRKVRLYVVGGRVLPRHRMVSTSWQIGPYSRAELMDGDARLREEEHAFLSAPPHALVRIGEEIARRTGLDIFAIDCAELPDGRIVLFEVTTCAQLVTGRQIEAPYGYTAEAVERITRAVEELFRGRLGNVH